MTTIQHRRGLASEWTSVNPILAEGELGLETDTGKTKYGDGTSVWAELEYSGGTAVVDSSPVRTVQGDTGDVRISLSQLDGLSLDVSISDEFGNVIEPGVQPGEFLGWDENKVARNLPINVDSLGLRNLFEPLDPNSRYRLFGYSIPLGGTLPVDLPEGAWVLDENNPDMQLFEDVNLVTNPGTAVTLPDPRFATTHILSLTNALCALTFPTASLTGAVEIEVVIDQNATVGNRQVSWPSNIRWNLVSGSSAAPILQTAPGARDRFRFKGMNGSWECTGRYAYGGPPAAGPTPTWVGSMTGNTGTVNNATGVSATYPSGLELNDVAIACISASGGTVAPDAAALDTLGWSFIEGPVTNNDTTPTLRSFLYKKRLNGAEDGTTITFPWGLGSDTVQDTERGLVTGGIFRGADFDRITFVPSRDTTQDTTLEYPAITPPVNNSMLAAFHAMRHGLAAGVPGVTITNTAWTERADHYEGRATDGTVVQYSSHLATRPLSGNANVEQPATTQTLTVTATFAGFMVAVAPVNV